MGPRGLTGSQGIKGDYGPKGSEGDEGLKGDPGLQGDIGLTGNTGIPGPTGYGEKGQKGMRGSGVLSGVGSEFTVWGRTDCPSTSSMIYEGLSFTFRNPPVPRCGPSSLIFVVPALSLHIYYHYHVNSLSSFCYTCIIILSSFMLKLSSYNLRY